MIASARRLGLLAVSLLAACAPAQEAEDANASESHFSTTLFGTPTDSLDLSLDAPLQELFAHRLEQVAAANPEAFVEPGTPEYKKPKVKGQLRLPGTNGATLPIEIKMHGASSLTECAFPKLAISIDVPSNGPDPRTGTPFQGTKKFFVRTHCGSAPAGTLTEQGRLANATSVRREAFAYTMLDAFAIPSHQVRLATIHYKDTGRTEPAGIKHRDGDVEFDVANTTLTSDAFLLEEDEEMAKRLGGTYVDPKKTRPWSSSPITHIGKPAIARVALFEMLLSNVDWRFDSTGELAEMEGGAKNLEIVRLGTGSELLVPYDFDIAKTVTGAALETPKLPEDPVDGLTNDDLTKEARVMAPLVAKAQRSLESFPFGSDRAGKTIFGTRLADFQTFSAGGI